MTTEPPSRYPLAWPAGRPRTKGRRHGTFRQGSKPIGVSAAISRLSGEVERLGGKLPILSTNYETRVDGSLILNRGTPSDPGAVVYFQLKGKPVTMACDAFTEVAQNIAALAGHIEAVRRQERYGVATAAEQLHAFMALPPPVARAPTPVLERPWWEVLGMVKEHATPETVRAMHRARCFSVGEGGQLTELNMARDAALAELTPDA